MALPAALLALAAWPAGAQVVTFDFDSAEPPLSVGQGLPQQQTASGVTATFSGPFSVQSASSTGYVLSQFSGKYLFPNGFGVELTVAFSRRLTAVTLTFATADFQQVEVPTTIQAAAFQGSAATVPVAAVSGHGTYSTDTMPQGTVSLSSTLAFDVIRVSIPYAPQAAPNFLVDNVRATLEPHLVRRRLRRAGV